MHLLNLNFPPLIQSTFTAIHRALAPNTRSTYGAGPLHFTQFCDKWGISEEACMPMDYPLLCAFIGEHMGLQSGLTIHSWMSGLRSWHIMHHTPWYGDNDWVQLAHISANKEGVKHKWPLRSPISIKHLSCLCCTLDLSNQFHAAVWAITLATFFGCCHLGETMVTTAAAFHKKYHMLCSTEYILQISLIFAL